jgi:hypothetical protein
MWRITVAIAGLLCSSTYVSAQPNKELYELQERCGKRAEEFFRREYGPAFSKDRQMFNYENHYSSRLNKCFLLEIADVYEKGKSASTKNMRLFDFNENREYGTFVGGICDGCGPMACLVQDQVCQSESEWRQLLKPFMEVVPFSGTEGRLG